MRLKSYFTRTVEDAIAAASQELGTDAMLVNSREAHPEARHLGEYEVVFATDALPAEATDAAAPLTRLSGDRLSVEVAELKKEKRDRDAYPLNRRRLTEELGDYLWYLVRLTALADKKFL